jgi:hypothetical protein
LYFFSVAARAIAALLGVSFLFLGEQQLWLDYGSSYCGDWGLDLVAVTGAFIWQQQLWFGFGTSNCGFVLVLTTAAMVALLWEPCIRGTTIISGAAVVPPS